MKANPGSFIETKPNSRPRLIRLLSLLAALLSPAAQAQLQIADLTRGSNSVALAWQGGRGPYLVRTSGNLGHWSDQGEPGLDTNRTLSAFAVRSFYRVADLNASNLYGDLFGLIQTEQGEFGELMARHRLKTRLWLYQTQGVPHTSATYTAAEYWGKLLVNLQTHWDGEVRTWTGALEDLGPMTTPRNNSLSITWTNGTGPAQRVFTLAFDFPYGVSAVRNNSGSTAPNASDPTMTLRCSYAAAQPELDWIWETPAFKNVTRDEAALVQMDPQNPANPFPEARNYLVARNGVEVHLHFLEGSPLYQGEPPWILKTFLLDRWLSPTIAGGGSLPAFSTDSYFSRTLLPGHHNFIEIVLLEPALDPALSEATRAALVAANIRYIYTFKDIAIGMSPDDIRYFGFNNTIRIP